MSGVREISIASMAGKRCEVFWWFPRPVVLRSTSVKSARPSDQGGWKRARLGMSTSSLTSFRQKNPIRSSRMQGRPRLTPYDQEQTFVHSRDHASWRRPAASLVSTYSMASAHSFQVEVLANLPSTATKSNVSTSLIATNTQDIVIADSDK